MRAGPSPHTVLLAFSLLVAAGKVTAQQPVPPPPAPQPPLSQPGSSAPEHRPGKIDPEFRADVIVAHVTAVQAGIGFTASTGLYLRSGIVGGLGFSGDGLSGRVDGFARFHSDPFRQSRWALYAGGGISGRFDRGRGARAYLLVLAGLDGPVRNGMTPSVELGLGGGTRIGVIFRRATGERR